MGSVMRGFQGKAILGMALMALACSKPSGMVEQGGELALGLDQVLGLSQIDVKAVYSLAAQKAKISEARLALVAGGEGGVHGELKVASRTYLADLPQRSTWKALIRLLFAAHERAEKVGDDKDEISKLCASEDLLRRTAGQALLASADERAYVALFATLLPETPPARIRQLTAVLLNTNGRLATIYLIKLSQRYPELLEELLGAVAERDEAVAVAYLTAVAAGHDEVSARQTARAALEMREQ